MTPSPVLQSRHRAGFTLIELLITMAIIAIIAAIAIPSYGAYTRKAHRADAQQYMMDMTVRQGEILLDSRNYADEAGMLAIMPTPTNVSNFYTISLTTSAAPPAFTITATAKGSQTADGNLTINSSGVKAPADKW